MGRGERWQTQVIQVWNATHTLPSPEEAGLGVAEGSSDNAPKKTPKPKHWWWM
jgi:hypothetical protein